MESDYEILELLNKLSAEICSKFDGIHFEINSMKSTISTLNKRIENNNLIIDKIDKTLDNLYKNANLSFDNNDNPDVNENINSLKNIVSNNSELLTYMNEDSSKKLLLISKDLKFITHKVLQSEKDLFNLQEEIKNTYK
ncbi:MULTISPECIES: hypothetical protein [Clostridium]|uniref:hypothetical protein n=1 Tax=Clostridium TaxID=1485 RepID=UPI0005C22BCE|nr:MULTISPECIES: hypothetical protein [Clostridium]AXB84470.1 hypothetical protein DRB99_05695 [Clostridium butyricum]KIU07390.1 BdrR [Clostridium butyricum]KJZ83561.1 hypothetical protein ClosIBUN22A_CONTIG98g02000 [Clostridium sp. IBUN22A]KJZ84839.1 Potassium uptake protein, integral membrane component, KtrB [Clostridium sp. IBUN13A]KJZ84906.1 hypothetical protein ClosIBUN125C_CONTIG58g03200 [Clostridium sp. IBUN125C]